MHKGGRTNNLNYILMSTRKVEQGHKPEPERRQASELVVECVCVCWKTVSSKYEQRFFFYFGGGGANVWGSDAKPAPASLPRWD